ncbi:3TM-type holin [Enterobacter soli]|uniref:3TM-type holin n=1 Tax=Enterobacter soli TaxID=885040 RepID=UPI004046B3FA
MMLNLIIGLLQQGMNFFIKKKTVEQETKTNNSEGQIEVNKVEIEKSTVHWRNFLGFVISMIILYNWIIVPVLDYFGIVLIQVPLGQLMQVLLIMIGGN